MTNNNKKKTETARANIANYAKRINRVIDYINNHLEEDLSLEQLSQVAHFSRFHFHRQFTEYTGISVGKLILLMRMKRASLKLVFNSGARIIDIALESGFKNPESFSRAFKKIHGQTPSEFRQTPQWQTWQTTSPLKKKLEHEKMKFEVELVEFPERKVAVLEHFGPENQVLQSTLKFIEWRKENGVRYDQALTYGIHYFDHSTEPPQVNQIDLCVTYDSLVQENPQGVINKSIPGGRCAKVRYIGSRDFIPVVEPLYREWLPASGEQLRDFPIFFHYVNVGPEVKEPEMLTDIYLPLK